jgi:4-hydroxyproline epimerase
VADYSAGDLIAWSPVVRKRLNEKYTFEHPENPAINRLSHMLWTGRPKHAEADARNAVFYGDKAIDRSPCGTGTSARMAQLHAKGRLKEGQSFVHESIIGSLFKGRVEKETSVKNKPAIIPSIGGWARQTGLNTIFIDDRDPFAHGFIVQ